MSGGSAGKSGWVWIGRVAGGSRGSQGLIDMTHSGASGASGAQGMRGAGRVLRVPACLGRLGVVENDPAATTQLD